MGRKRVWALCAAFGLVLLTAGAVWAAQAPPPEPGESVEGESVEKDERAERIEVSWRPAAGQSSGDVHIFRSLRKRHSFDWHQGGFGLRTALGRGEPGFQLLYRQSGKSATEFNIQVGVVYRVPEPLFIFHFYGGGGVHYIPKDGSSRPFMVTGYDFLFLYSESGFVFDEPSQTFSRFGFRIPF